MRKQKNVVEDKDTKDIFDIENINDLPEECCKEINKARRMIGGRVRKIAYLFTLKPLLTRKEIIAGMYRLHGIVVTKNYISSTMTNLVGRGILQSPKKGVYKTVLELPAQYKKLLDEIAGEG